MEFREACRTMGENMFKLVILIMNLYCEYTLAKIGLMYIKGMKKIKFIKKASIPYIRLYNQITKWDFISTYFFAFIAFGLIVYSDVFGFNDRDNLLNLLGFILEIIILMQSVLNLCVGIKYGQYSYLTKNFFASTEGEFLKKDCTFMITQTNNNVYELLIYEKNKEMPRVFVITEKHRETIEMINEHYPKRTTVTGISHDEYSL